MLIDLLSQFEIRSGSDLKQEFVEQQPHREDWRSRFQDALYALFQPGSTLMIPSSYQYVGNGSYQKFFSRCVVGMHKWLLKALRRLFH